MGNMRKSGGIAVFVPVEGITPGEATTAVVNSDIVESVSRFFLGDDNNPENMLIQAEEDGYGCGIFAHIS